MKTYTHNTPEFRAATMTPVQTAKQEQHEAWYVELRKQVAANLLVMSQPKPPKRPRVRVKAVPAL